MQDKPAPLWRKSWKGSRDKPASDVGDGPTSTLSPALSGLSSPRHGLKVKVKGTERELHNPYLSPTSPLSPRSPPPMSPHRPPPAPPTVSPLPQLRLSRGGSLEVPCCASPSAGAATPTGSATPVPPQHRRTTSWSLGGSQSSTPSHRRSSSGAGFLASLGSLKAERAASLRSELDRIVRGGQAAGASSEAGTASRAESLCSPSSPRRMSEELARPVSLGAGPLANPQGARPGAGRGPEAPMISMEEAPLVPQQHTAPAKTSQGCTSDLEELLTLSHETPLGTPRGPPMVAPSRVPSGDWQRDLLDHLRHPDPQAPATPGGDRSASGPLHDTLGFQSPPGYVYTPEGLVPAVQGLTVQAPSPPPGPRTAAAPQGSPSPVGYAPRGLTPQQRTHSLPTGLRLPSAYPNPHAQAQKGGPAFSFEESAAW